MGYKKIHLVRHAEAEHNVNRDNYSFPDAVLTHKGKQQCVALDNLTQHTLQQSAQLLVSSPLRRTLQTSLIGLPTLVDRLGGPSSILVMPELQENSSSPADTGSSRDELSKIEEFDGIDFSRLDDLWNSKTGFWSSDPKALRRRAAWTRNWLANRPEDEIVVVSHGSALKYLTEDFSPHNLWYNTQVKSYTLRPPATSGAKNHRLVPLNPSSPRVVSESPKSLLPSVLRPTRPSIEQNS